MGWREYLVETCGALVVFLSGEGAESVVFGFGGGGGAGAVVEGCVPGGGFGLAVGFSFCARWEARWWGLAWGGNGRATYRGRRVGSWGRT